MQKNVVLLDTDHIKRYVFGTDSLKEIRGASALFDELNRIAMAIEARKIDPDAQVIYANGGAGMFRIAAEKTDELIRTIRQHYREQTATGSITGVAESAAADEKQLLQRLFLRAQIEKANTPHVQTINAHPLFKFCESCGEEYAVTTDAELRKDAEHRAKNENPELLCQSCFNKRERDLDIKKEIRKEIRHLLAHQEQGQPSSFKLWDRLLFGVKDMLNKTLDRPEDLNTLGEMSSPSNYIAVIYADGNNMGTIIDQFERVDELQCFSNAVDEAIYQAVIQAMRGPLWPSPNDACFPFDVLLLGGDDLVMVTTADRALDAVMTITKAFTRAFCDNPHTRDLQPLIRNLTGQNSPTLSVGVAFVHAKFPFATSLELAESALKFAKTGLAELRQAQPDAAPQGMINFMVVHSSNALDFEAIYEQELYSKKEHLYRTLRPYTIEKMEALMEAARRNLHGIPTTKLHQTREALFLDSRQRAALATFAALVGAKEREKDDIFRIVKRFAEQAGSNSDDFPWYAVKDKDDVSYYTPLLDAIELHDFLSS